MKALGGFAAVYAKNCLNRLRCHLGADSWGPKYLCVRCGQGRMNPFAAMRGDEKGCQDGNAAFHHI